MDYVIFFVILVFSVLFYMQQKRFGKKLDEISKRLDELNGIETEIVDGEEIVWRNI